MSNPMKSFLQMIEEQMAASIEKQKAAIAEAREKAAKVTAAIAAKKAANPNVLDLFDTDLRVQVRRGSKDKTDYLHVQFMRETWPQYSKVYVPLTNDYLDKVDEILGAEGNENARLSMVNDVKGSTEKSSTRYLNCRKYMGNTLIEIPGVCNFDAGPAFQKQDAQWAKNLEIPAPDYSGVDGDKN